ncbi:ribonuclease T2 family protein [Mesorhizobium sp. L-8-3]|uniref:ribonuclease T2 family protein n=1 Tax=Mesorhizobium sp. L-8-3 TaxID=2744522 RepID=UPI0019374C21|nr:ribonuclease [Mesorhizobium sp. L-8-3]BCH22287.1 ribonuclease T(2) [Mesorhizobium sp. L-8-3]
MTRVPRILAVVAGIMALSPSARAEVALDGAFTAGENCSAFQSLNKKSNPVPLEADRSYRIVAGNKQPPTHYLIIVPGAAPERRWAPVDCGTAAVEGSGPAGEASVGRTDYVLAASWQPGFCETKPGKAECESQTADRFDASHFALHGLWPQPRSLGYCNVGQAAVADDKAGRWDRLPEVVLEPATAKELDQVMPGTQSHLDRHEWIKHGTCYGPSMEEYFGESLSVMRQLNTSPVQALFEGRVGGFLSFDDISTAFDEGFGAGAGDRVRMQCVRDGGRLIISELTIGLGGEITPYARLADLIAAAAPTRTECPGGIVDPVGLQ